MDRMARRGMVALFALAVGLASASEASAASHPYIVIRDDGAFASKTSGPALLSKRTIDAFKAAGTPIPDVISVWTTFPMLGNDFATYIDPRANDVSGINIPVSPSSSPPLRAILYHNNATAIAKRAALQRAPVDGFASYLFLLEFTHNWGPEIIAPAPGTQDLIGFDYHWSFFLEGTSPAGGNVWKDNADGTFTVVPRAPKDVTYTPLDLYLMGLVDKSQVPPFGVLVQTTVPAMPVDPLWGGAFAGHSFPWFDTTNPPLTVTATRRVITIDDVIASNGVRSPAAGTKTSFTLGIALVAGQNETDEQVLADEAIFDPIASDLAPAFARATGQRGTLDVITQSSDPTTGAGGAGGAGAGGSGGAASSTSSTGGSGSKADAGGCSVSSTDGGSTGALFGAAAALLAGLSRKVGSRRKRA